MDFFFYIYKRLGLYHLFSLITYPHDLVVNKFGIFYTTAEPDAWEEVCPRHRFDTLIFQRVDRNRFGMWLRLEEHQKTTRNSRWVNSLQTIK